MRVKPKKFQPGSAGKFMVTLLAKIKTRKSFQGIQLSTRRLHTSAKDLVQAYFQLIWFKYFIEGMINRKNKKKLKKFLSAG
jgi:hypothetical protein